MQFAVCVVPVVPVRKTPAHESEMVNQLLFGETMQVLETAATNWYRVKSLPDQYMGWVNGLQVKIIDKEIDLPDELWVMESPGIAETIHTDTGPMHIPFGSSLPGYNGKGGMIGDLQYMYEGAYARKRNKLFAGSDRMQLLVEKWEQVPYLWGGRTKMGVDCSGLIQVIFKMMGIDLLRDASQQSTQGEPVDFLQQARCGDLAFFDNEAGQIYHVGILLNSNQIVHASGKVRKDTIDNEGIFNQESGQRTHQLRIIKRYF